MDRSSEPSASSCDVEASEIALPKEKSPRDAKATTKGQSESRDSSQKSVSPSSEPKRSASTSKRKRNRGGGAGDRDSNAPKVPLTGYVRFLQDSRERVKEENPDAHYSEITRKLAIEWSNLKRDEKRKYLDDAQRDREQYLKDLKDYQQTDAYKDFCRGQSEKKTEKKRKLGSDDTLTPPPPPPPPPQRSKPFVSSVRMNVARSTLLQQQILAELDLEEDDLPGCDIPIFTDEFLQHNKVKETELSGLRKSNVDLEEQNSILSRHIGNMKIAIERLEKEADQQQVANSSLRKYLASLKKILVESFVTVPLPGSTEVPTVDTIDAYLAKLHELLLDETRKGAGDFAAQVKGIVSQLDYKKKTTS